MNKLTFAFIIRFHYSSKDLRFKWRFEYFKNEVLPRILNQTEQDFDICIRCNPEHNELFKSLHPKIKTFQVENEFVEYKQSKLNGKKYFEDFVEWDRVLGLEKYDVQMGLDSDDLIEKDYFSIIKELVYKNIGTTLHICFQPKLFRLSTGKTKPMRTYSEKRGSAFFALYQPSKDNYKFAYCMSHIILGRIAEKTIVVPEGHCMATAHDINESTGK